MSALSVWGKVLVPGTWYPVLWGYYILERLPIVSAGLRPPSPLEIVPLQGRPWLGSTAKEGQVAPRLHSRLLAPLAFQFLALVAPLAFHFLALVAPLVSFLNSPNPLEIVRLEGRQ